MNYTTKILHWALLIQQYEGWNPPSVFNLWRGSRSFQNNNPGNLKAGSYTEGLGATGIDKDNFLIFPSMLSGFLGLCTFLVNACNGMYDKYDPTKGLDQFYDVYAPAYDSNIPLKYACYISDNMGIPLHQPINTMLMTGGT